MGNYVLLRKAVSDLENIWDYTLETWSENQADRYYQLLEDGFEEIAKTAEKGRSYEGIEQGLKGYRIGKHIIFYMIVKQRVEIVRVHEQIDLKQQLGG